VYSTFYLHDGIWKYRDSVVEFLDDEKKYSMEEAWNVTAVDEG
jgi:hypothetical protein